jgi:hypothetical protein
MMIRNLIREMLLQEKTLHDVVPKRIRPPDLEGDYEEGGGLQYGNKSTTEFRRGIKKDWNKYADMSFFQDPKKLQVIHYLGLYSARNSLTDYFPEGKVVPGKIPGINFPSRNELSCFGYTPPGDPVGYEVYATGPFFTFKKYRVTLVASEDAGTERLSRATPDDIERMKGSGLAKRPYTLSRSSTFPIDAEDLEGYNILEEVVIDNWIVDTCYGPKEEAEYAAELGLKYKVLW